MDAHVLVTGGAGFIGSHSVDALLAAGARVRVLDNFSSGKRANLPASHSRLEVTEGDIRDVAAVAGALEGISHVLHLAAQIFVQVSIREPVASCHSNVVGFLNVLDGARRAGVRRVVYASSAAVYGTPEQLPLNEDSRTAPLSPYGLEKCIDDQYAALYLQLYGFSAMGMRYFNVYGPRQDPASPYSGVISKWSDALGAGRPLRIFGDGKQTRDFIYVKDIARYNVLALQSDAGGVCNVGTGNSVTLLALIDALEEAAGAKAERKFEPAAPGDIQASAMSPQRLNELFGAQAATPLLEGLQALLHS
ncbi:MAG: NAD-dependent epimerase/dehydratase family protein [Burkholderiales bacterium]|nr:NAD-dependent epimerase/dehydratase family protein [Burkholderiales bacterium]